MTRTIRQGSDGQRSVPRPPLAGADAEAAGLAPGAHLVTRRRGYDHHGIYVGDGRVVHYGGLARPLNDLLADARRIRAWGGLARSWRRGPVEEVSLERFAAGRSVRVKPADDARYGGPEIIARARSRLGEDCYRIASNNCEHFCEWCIHGEARSEQIERVLGLLRRCLPFARRFAPAAGRGAQTLAA